MTTQAISTAASLPGIGVNTLRGRALDLDHYLLAPYDTCETWQMKVVVVDPTLDAPAWVMSRATKNPRPRKALALAVPSLSALALDLAQQATGMATDYITVYDFPREFRSKGQIRQGKQVLAPWLRS